MKNSKKIFLTMVVVVLCTAMLAGCGMAQALDGVIPKIGSKDVAQTSGQYITEQEAQRIALEHANVSEEELSAIRVQLDETGTQPEYEVEFYAQGKEFDYDIDAVTGRVNACDFDAEYSIVPEQASDDYIGEEKAQQIALENAGKSADEVTFVTVKLEKDDGVWRYDVEFYAGNEEFDYEIDAVSGSILSSDREIENDGQNGQSAAGSAGSSSSGSTNTEYIGESKAKTIALNDAGLKESQVTFTKAKLEKDDGKWEYSVEFYSGSTEYDYEIDALSGKILSKDKEIDDDAKSTATSSQQSSSSYIGESKAKSIALSHAGLKQSQVTFTKAKLEKDDGRWEYSVEFYSGSAEYDYEIDALSGKILSSDKDVNDDDKASSSSSQQGSSSYIGESKAKSIALGHAGVSASNAKNMKVELDRDDGKAEYEVEFIAGGMEYTYEIDAASGKVLSYEKERDD